MSPQMNANERKYSKSIIGLLNRTAVCHVRNATSALIMSSTALFHLRSLMPRKPALYPPGRSTSVKKCSRHFCTFICGLIVSLIVPPSFADTAQPDIRKLDRMFTTKYERTQLDAQRRRLSSGESLEAAAAGHISTAPQTVEMQGIMQRDNGSNVAWINGQSTLKGNTIDDNIRVKGQPKALSGANVSIDGQTVRLKPGQVWQAENNKVEELYRTKVTAPVTKGTDEVVPAVQTKEILDGLSKVLPKTDLAKPEATLQQP